MSVGGVNHNVILQAMANGLTPGQTNPMEVMCGMTAKMAMGSSFANGYPAQGSPHDGGNTFPQVVNVSASPLFRVPFIQMSLYFTFECVLGVK